MRFHHLDLNLLVALDALLAERSVARAAERLHLSPSAASGALARLRDYFDDELLVQVGRKLQPTPRALALQTAVRDVLLRVDANIARQPPFDAATSRRTFRVIASDYAQFIFIPHLLAVCAEQQGSVGFEFIAPAGDPAKQLERGEVDAVVLPQGHIEAELPRLVLHEDRFVAVVRRDGGLAGSEWTLDRYLAARHVVLQTAPGSGVSPLEKWFAAQGNARQRPVHIRTSEVATLMALLAHGDSVATVHERLAQRLSAAWPVVLRPVPMALPRLVQTLQWHPYAERDPGVAWLRECARQAAERMAAADDMHRGEASAPPT